MKLKRKQMGIGLILIGLLLFISPSFLSISPWSDSRWICINPDQQALQHGFTGTVYIVKDDNSTFCSFTYNQPSDWSIGPGWYYTSASGDSCPGYHNNNPADYLQCSGNWQQNSMLASQGANVGNPISQSCYSCVTSQSPITNPITNEPMKPLWWVGIAFIAIGGVMVIKK